MQIVIHSWGHGQNHGQLIQAMGLQLMTQELTGLKREQILGRYINPSDFREELVDALGCLTLDKYRLFKSEWARLVGLMSEEKDAIHIYGSDHIWGGTGFYGLDERMFGDSGNVNIAYAPSCGNYVYSENEITTLSKRVGSFRSISVRDRATQLQVGRLGIGMKFRAPIVCDPAFFLGDAIRNRINSNAVVDYNKITVYANIKILPDSAERYMERQGLEVIYAGYSPRKKMLKRARMSIRGLDLACSILYPMSRSRLILTNTFHGCVMALMAKRPFIAVVNSNLKARLDSPLFDSVHRRRFMEMEEFQRLMMQPEDVSTFYDSSDIEWACIDKEIVSSREWLKNALEEAS